MKSNQQVKKVNESEECLSPVEVPSEVTQAELEFDNNFLIQQGLIED